MIFAHGHIILGLLFLGWVALHDVRTFEIDFGALFISAIGVFAHDVLGGVSLIDIAIGVALWGLIAVTLHIIRPSWLGAGDIYLFMFMGLVSGLTGIITLMGIYCIVSLVVSYAYSRARGKRPFRSLFPAALPALIAVVLYRVAYAFNPDINTILGGANAFASPIPLNDENALFVGTGFYTLIIMVIIFWLFAWLFETIEQEASDDF